MEANTTKLADQLMRLHTALEDAGIRDDDWSLARTLEDRLGSGQYLPGDVEKAQQLLSRHAGA